MNRKMLSKGLAVVSATLAIGAVSLVASQAFAQWVPPPAEYVASTEPVYYENHAAYWYNNAWYWRDAHNGWNHYEHEPAFLADRRAHFVHNVPVRRAWDHRR